VNVQEDHRNYGRPREPGDELEGSGGHSSGGEVSVQDERTWSMLSHLSIFLNLFTGFLGPVAAGAVWLFYRERSQRVAFHSLQSLWYQVAWLVVLTVGWTATFFLMAVLIGFLLVPLMAILSAVPFVQSSWAAYKIGRGEEYRYPFIANAIGGEQEHLEGRS
jgi:uncharacterized Tic20 family protein